MIFQRNLNPANCCQEIIGGQCGFNLLSSASICNSRTCTKKMLKFIKHFYGRAIK